MRTERAIAAVLIAAASCSGKPPIAPCTGDDTCETSSYCGSGGRCTPLPAGFAVTLDPVLPLTVRGKTRVTASSVGGVGWSVQEGDAGGTIDSAGIYTAPEVTGLYHVVATSTADPAKSAVAEVTVVARPITPSITVDPVMTANDPGHTASVSLQPGSSYLWTIEGGTITSPGGTAGAIFADANYITFNTGPVGTLTVTCAQTNAAGTRGVPGVATINLVAPPATPSITSASPVAPGASGLTASVAAHAGMTYRWAVRGGNITSAGGEAGENSGGTSRITFDAGPACSFQLTCVEINAAGTSSEPGVAVVSVIGPVTIATSQPGALGVAVDGTNAYWTNSYFGPDAGVFKAPLDGGSPVPLALGLSSPRSIAVDATSAYYADSSGGVFKVGLAGGTPVKLSPPGSSTPFGLAIDATNVYWTDPNNGLVMKALLDGGAPAPIATGDDPRALAIDGSFAYFTAGAAGKVTKVPLDGGSPVSLAKDQAYPSAVAVDSTSAYWTNQQDGTVMQVALDGGAPRALFDAGTDLRGIATDGAAVYWTDAQGQVMKIPLDGGPAALVADGQNTPQGIALDQTCVYWTNTDGGTVRKAPK